jgi:hypothetical protein
MAGCEESLAIKASQTQLSLESFCDAQVLLKLSSFVGALTFNFQSPTGFALCDLLIKVKGEERRYRSSFPAA